MILYYLFSLGTVVIIIQTKLDIKTLRLFFFFRKTLRQLFTVQMISSTMSKMSKLHCVKNQPKCDRPEPATTVIQCEFTSIKSSNAAVNSEKEQ